MANFVRTLISVLGVTALICLFNGYFVNQLAHRPDGHLSEEERHRYLEAEEQNVFVEGGGSFSQRRQLNILTLGGSVTWGAVIDQREDAYPFLLQNSDGHNVTNLAIRATGSDYPAQCISSMLEEEQEREGSTYHPSIPFDVIVFDFSINGMDGFELLLKRLQIRFPEALIIYIDLWSLQHRGNMGSEEVRKLVRGSGGHVYFLGNEAMPTEEFDYRDLLEAGETEDVLKLFASDKHHLSPYGHKLVRHQIRNIIEMLAKIPIGPALGSWLGGDKCTSWYEDGVSDLNIIDGGEMNEWDENKHKWAIEVAGRGMTFEYNNDGSNDAVLNLQYMTKAPNSGNPYTSWYPPVIVKITQDESDMIEARRCAWDSVKQSIKERETLVLSTESDCLNEEWTFISGLQHKPGLRGFHITEISHAGMLRPGRNFVFVHPVGGRSTPFRVTATIVCEACGRLGWTEV